MTPTPLPPESDPAGSHGNDPLPGRSAPDSLSAATVETLVRFDEADARKIAELEGDPRSRRVLHKLRAADRFLLTGQLRPGDAETHALPAESLFAFGRGELEAAEADEVQEYLDKTPSERAWVESLRTSVPPATLTWDPVEAAPEAAPVLAGPGSQRGAATKSIPGWVTWIPLAAAALILAMAISGNERRNVLDGGLPNSPIVRSAGTEALLFPRGRVLASTSAVTTYASRPLFEVAPVEGASQYSFQLRDVTARSAFAEGEIVWESTSTTHQATAPALAPGHYVWRASARVNGIDRDLGSLSFTVVPATAVERALLVRAATSQRDTMPGILREDIRRLHASGFLTDARGKARALPPGDERDEYLGPGSEQISGPISGPISEQSPDQRTE